MRTSRAFGSFILLVLLATAPCAASVAVARPIGGYTPSEIATLNAVTDGDEQFDGAALAVLIGRAARLAGEDESLAQARLTPLIDLFADSAAHRGNLLHFNVRVWRVSPWTPPAEVTAGEFGVRPLWRLDCTERATQAAMVILVIQLPEGLSEGEHPNPPSVTVDGLFFKTVRMAIDRPASSPTETQLYPVLVARTLYGVGVKPGNTGKVILAALLVVLAAGYLWVRYVATGKRRNGATTGGPVSEKPATGEKASKPVDKDLVREVTRFKARREQGENT